MMSSGRAVVLFVRFRMPMEGGEVMIEAGDG